MRLDRAEDLAREAALGHRNTDQVCIEGAESETSMTRRLTNCTPIALEAAGVEFIDENGGGPGVRLRKRQQKKG